MMDIAGSKRYRSRSYDDPGFPFRRTRSWSCVANLTQLGPSDGPVRGGSKETVGAVMARGNLVELLAR